MSIRKLKRQMERDTDRRIGKLNKDLVRAGKQALRDGRDICVCGPEQCVYDSQAAADADQRDGVICTDCGKEQVRVKLIKRAE